MKFLTLVLALTTFSAHASYYAVHCSNATGSVKWAQGHNSNSASITYYGSKAGVKEVPLHKLDLKIESENIVSEENIHRCGYSAYKKVYTALVTITAAADAPNALDFLGGEKIIKTEVICQHDMNSLTACP